MRRSPWSWGQRAFAAAALLTLAPAALASALQVSPILVQFAPDQPAASVNLQNAGDAPLNAQVRIFGWTQKDGQDRLQPDPGVQVSPPISAIPALGEQVVRLVRRDHQVPDREVCYRLLVDELPVVDANSSNKVIFRLRYSVPVFVAPAGFPAPPKLSWSMDRHGGVWLLKARNEGGLHAQFGATRLRWPDGQEFSLSDGLFGYALAGSSRSWELPQTLPAPVAGLKVLTTIDHAAVTADVRIDTP